MKRLGVLCLLLLVFCAGCGLPIPRGTTAVRKVSGPQPNDDTDSVRRIPPGPVPGESTEAIVNGFLAAGINADVARDFLTAGNFWNPLESTTVFAGSPSVAIVGKPTGNTVTAIATTTPLLVIGADGETSVPVTNMLNFVLTKEDGEWRIAQPPRGTQLNQVDLSSSFRRGSLGWLSPDRLSLVRQSVLLPGDSSQLTLGLVKQLLDGPSLPLVNAGVVSALPQRFTAVSASLVGAQLLVALQSNGASIPPGDLSAVRAEFAATLLSSEVTSIQVDVNSQPLLGGAVSGAPITAADETSFDRDLAGSDGVGASAYLDTADTIDALATPFGTPTPRTTTSPTAVPTSSASPSASPGIKVPAPNGLLQAFAVSADGLHFAELRKIGAGVQPVLITTGSGTPEPLPSGNYTSVAWGANDALWLATSTGDVFVEQDDRPPVKVTQLMALRDVVIAPDGVHMVGISTDGALVAGLADASSSPPALTSLSVVAPSLTHVTAVAVVGSGAEDQQGGDGLQLLVAATRSANPLLPRASVSLGKGLWRVATGAPDPTESTAETLSESVRQERPACVGSEVTGLVARPKVIPLAECADKSLEAFQSRTRQWSRVATGLAGYPLG